MIGLFDSLRDPWWLLLWFVIPLGVWLRWRRGSPGVVFAPAPVLSGSGRLPRSWRMRLLPLPMAMQVIGLLLVVFALARPVRRVELPQRAEGIDIFLCIDVSSSMSARDLDPQRTRLDVAVEAASRFVDGRPQDRLGLISFARYPDVLCPLTLDHRAIRSFLSELSVVEPDGLEDQTGIGTAVARAAQVLSTSTAPSKVVILLTDGEENVATADTPDEIGPTRASRVAAELGVRVYTIVAGIGKRERSGQWVELDTGQVRKLAESTGGAFYEARDAGAITRVYETINQLEKVEFEEPRYELIERFIPFLATALGLVVVGWLLQATVFEVLP